MDYNKNWRWLFATNRQQSIQRDVGILATVVPLLACGAWWCRSEGLWPGALALTLMVIVVGCVIFKRQWSNMTGFQRGVAVTGVALIVLSAVLTTPVLANAQEYEPTHAWASVHAWEDASTGEKWGEMIPLDPAVVHELGDQPIWFYIGPEVGEKLPTIPANAEMVPLDHILVNEMIGDILMGPLYSESDSEPDGCYLSCYEMRTGSVEYQSILNQSQNQAVGGALADGALAGGVGLMVFASGALLANTGAGAGTAASATAAFAAAGLAGTLAGILLIGVVVVAVGATLYVANEWYEAREAANNWAADKANGCPGCGFTGRTLGWDYDAGNDMCVNPECQPEEDGEPDDTGTDDGGGSGGGGGGSKTDGSGPPPDTSTPGGGSWGGVEDEDGDEYCSEGTLYSCSGSDCEPWYPAANAETECTVCIYPDNGGSDAVCTQAPETTPPEETETEG